MSEKELIEKLVENIQNKNTCVITGGRKSGKSYILSKVREILKEEAVNDN